MKAVNPLTGESCWFCDKAMSFGASISCPHFQRFSNAVSYLVKVRTGKKNVNYLDDYLFAPLMKAVCNGQVNTFIDLCKEINFPVNLDKTFWGTPKLIFLGLLIDMVNQLVSIPADKVERAFTLIDTMLNKRSRKITLRRLQQLTGFLNFLCRCIMPGRTFTRRLYAQQKISGATLPHHHLRVTAEMKIDLELRKCFLTHPSAFCRPFLDFTNTITSQQI